MIFLDQILGNLKKRSDTDFIDRLNYYYTPMLIVFFGLTLSAKQYVGQPIQCWVPAQFTGAWEQYSEYYCFVQNTYFVPFHEDLPTTYDDRDKREIGYYQWVPFILALQAFLFFLPVMIWRLLNWQSGICVKTLVNAAIDVNNVNQSTCSKNTKLVACHMKDSLQIQSHLEPRGSLFSFLFYGKHYACYVSSLYLFIKLLFILNVIGQFFILNSFLGSRYTFWGWEILRDIMHGREWTESGHFPRVTMCDFKVRVLGNLHNWSIQCVLQINMFNEKIYLFLWWWFLVVGILNVMNFFYWVGAITIQSTRRQFVYSYLKVFNDLDEDPKKIRMTRDDIDDFTDRAVRPDGVFVLRMVSANAGHVMTTQLVGELWKQWHTSDADDDQKQSGNGAPLDAPDGGNGKMRRPAPTAPPRHDDALANGGGGGGGFHETLYDPSEHRRASPDVKSPLLAPSPDEHV